MTSGKRHAHDASRAQAEAARPDASVWVSANAGSGKTRVLTNRVARLLLAGAAPDRVLCITYTKAAAAEMRERLFKTLGGWALADDAALDHALDALLAEDEPPIGPDGREQARRLFAQALETPGGLQIQTIHSFCERLLSRFPFEAGVAPRFAVLDDAEADLLLEEALDGVVVDAETDADLAAAFASVSAHLDEVGFADMLKALRAHRGALSATAEGGADVGAVTAALGGDPATWEAEALSMPAARPERLRAAAAALATSTSSSDQSMAAALGCAAEIPVEATEARIERLSEALLTQSGAVRKRLATKAGAALAPDFASDGPALAEALQALRLAQAAQMQAERSVALARLGGAVYGRFEAAKRAKAVLDYDDLVERAVGLLTRSEARDWVRYKLDGGVEHILVDEAQDTSPAQWDAIGALAEEFFAGAGAERAAEARGPRTLFAVGDEKQSIYSFQGAEPRRLAEKGRLFEARANAVGARFERGALATSFRSAPAILAFVDRVFAGDARRGLVFDDASDGVRHRAHRADHPGRVDVWPSVTPLDAPETADWTKPVDAPEPAKPAIRLAHMLAQTIVDWIGVEPLPARGRTIRAGDVMVLVRSRGTLSFELIKQLKRRGAPVAGSDRLSLEKEIAVADLSALARFCLFPEDDLTLAALLRSPLFDVDEASLFELAHHRPARRPLYFTLQDRRTERPDWDAAYARLADVQRRADFDRPFEVLQHVLGPGGGRARFAARLGAEAEDAVDELLAQALRLESKASPTLQSLVAALAARRTDVKRELEQGRDEIRVMTVHGAKGLEAPVVVLPDTFNAGGRRGASIFPPPFEGAPPIWAGPSSDDGPAVAEARAAAQTREAEERRRLLYVALTRAEDRLLVCGAASKTPKAAAAADDASEPSWHALCWAAAEGGAAAAWPGLSEAPDAPMARSIDESGDGRVTEPTVGPGAAADVERDEPDWLRRPAAKETAPADVAPSDLGGAAPGETETAAASMAATGSFAPEIAARRGELVHLFLERGVAAPDAAEIALGFADLSEAVRRGAAAEAARVLDAPEFAHLFGPDSRAEVPVTAVLPDLGPGEIHGVVDRLTLSEDGALIVDFKTGAAPEAPPEAYVRQLAVYRRAVADALGRRDVSAALLWTAEPRLQVLDPVALDAAYARAAAELDRRRGGS